MSEVSDLFTTGAAIVLSGNRRGGTDTGVLRRCAMEQRSIRALHHRQIGIQGNTRCGLGFCKTKDSAPSPPGIQNSPLQSLCRFRMTKASERLETKTPPERGSGGVRNTELRMGSAHSTSMRKRARVDAGQSAWLKRDHRAADETPVAFHRPSQLSRAPIAREGRGV